MGRREKQKTLCPAWLLRDRLGFKVCFRYGLLGHDGVPRVEGAQPAVSQFCVGLSPKRTTLQLHAMEPYMERDIHAMEWTLDAIPTMNHHHDMQRALCPLRVNCRFGLRRLALRDHRRGERMAMEWDLDRHCLSRWRNLTCSNHQHKFVGQHWKRCELGVPLNFAIIFQCPKP